MSSHEKKDPDVMKRSPSIPFALAGFAAALMLALSPPNARADTAAEAAPPADEAAQSEAPEITPSRLVTPEQLKEHVSSLSAILHMRDREIDPFGQFQDPDARPVIRPTVADTSKRQVQPQTFPFDEIINRLQINTVMPGEGKFLLNTRLYGVGERINLNFRMRTIPVDIVSVSSSSIEFRNAENGDTAKLQISVLPVGMTPGNQEIQTPGMIRKLKNAPIDLDSEFPADDRPANR